MPDGYCQCGCGGKTTIIPRTSVARGLVRGAPMRFIMGHAVRVRPVKPAVERFWTKVDKNGPVHPVLGTACWLWTGATIGRCAALGRGYGVFVVASGPLRRVMATHYSYALHIGPVPAGLFVLHHCDNPPCVNPAHLFTGTNSDNMSDMYEKKRHPVRNRHSPLTMEQAMAIHADPREGLVVAREFGVSSSTVSAIRAGKRWGLGRSTVRRTRRGAQGVVHGNARLTEDAVREIRASAESAGALSRKYGVGRGVIWSVRTRRVWKHI